MKKNFTFNLLVILFLVSLAGIFNNLLAQTISYPTAAEAITRGYGQSKVTWQIAFPSACTKYRVNLNLGQSESIEQLETIYVPGSFTATNADGSPLAGATVTESSISDLDSVFFDITGVTTGQIIKFTAMRKANCGIGQSTKDAIYVYGLDGSNNPITTGPCYFFENDENNNNYNLLAPAFTIVPTAALNNVSLNQTYTRSFDLINGGNGCANKAGLWLKYGAGEAQLISLKIGATALTPVFTNGDSTYYEVSGANLTADQLFCNGEKITFTEEVKILKCDALTTYGGSWADHAGIACSKVTATAPVVMNSAVPLLTSTIENPNYNYCFAGESITQTIKITNSGLSLAKNISYIFDTHLPGSMIARQKFDFTKPWNIKDENGLTLGQVSNFRDGVNNYNICSTAGLGLIRGDFAGLEIGPGKFVTLDIPFIADDISKCACSEGNGWTGFRVQSNYTNQCASASYVSNYDNHMFRAYILLSAKLEAPVDLQAGQKFDIKVDLSRLMTINSPDGSGTSYLAIPLANTGFKLQPGITTLPFRSFTVPIAIVNDTLKITLPQNMSFAPQGDDKVDIPLVANCDGPNLPADRNKFGGTKTLEFFMHNKYSACAPFEKISCRTLTTTVHCPDPCPKGGATPLAFSLDRVTLGQPDNDNNHIADASGSIDLSKIDIKHSVNGDTLRGRWNAVVFPNVLATDPNFGKPIQNVYIDFDLGYYYPAAESLIPVPNAKIKIYPNRDKNATPIECTVTPTIVGNKAHYEFNQSCRGGDWSNDSLVIEALFVVFSFNNENNNGYQATSFYNFVTNNQLYSTYTPKPSPQVAPIDGETYTCDHFNDYSQISRIFLSPWIPADQIVDGCDNNIYAHMRQYVRDQELPIIFRNEFRSFNTLEKMTVKIPPGFTYRSNSAKVSHDDNGTNGPIPNAQVSQSGNFLIFDLKPMYIANGGPIRPHDEINQISVTFKIDPTCEAKNGTYPSSTNTSVTGNGINTPTSIYSAKNFTEQASGYKVTLPQPVLTGDGEVLSFDNTATFELAVQNLSNIVSAESSYLFIDPKNSFTNIVVKEGATVLTPEANGIYKLGTIAPGGNRPITISAVGGKCIEDSMRVNFGYGCNGYPTTPTVAGCIQSRWLKIIQERSQIQLTVEKQPDALKDLCTQDFVQYKISSALAANVVNPRFGVIPPAGLVIDYAQLEYPAGSGNWETVAPDFNPVSGITSYQVNKDPMLAGTGHSAAPVYGLPGTLTDASPEGRSAQLRVYYTTNCDFISGSKIAVRQRGTRPCGDFIPASLGNNGIVRSNAININGSTPVGSIDVKNVLSPTALSCNAPTTISGTLTPVGTTTEMSDSLQVTLPTGINYVGNYTGALSLVAGFPKPGLAGTTVIRWAVPAGTVSGTALNYQFDVNASPTSGCGQFNILSEVSRSIAPLVCGNGICPRPGKAIIGSSETNVTVARPEISFGAIVQTNQAIAIPGNTLVLDIPISNSSTTVATAGSLQVEYYCGNSATPFLTQPYPNAVPANGSTTASVSVTIPMGAGCQMGEPLRMVIKPTASSCICSQTEKSIETKVIYDIKGNVFRDANGLIGSPFNTVDGNGTNANNQVFAHLLAADGVTVLETVPVKSDGTYEFIGKSPATYSVAISKSSTDPNAGLAGSWVNTGEHNGTGSGSDGTVNGKSAPFTLTNANVTDINFGIQQPPLAIDRNLPPQVNPGGTIQAVVPSLLGIDPEDGPKGTGDTFTIETLPTNGTLYYNGIPVTVGQVIGDFEPSKLTVDPIDGDVTVSFTYTVTDAAGYKSEPAIINMPFYTLQISGTIFNDANGLNPSPANTVDGIPTNVTDQIFAHLLDGAGTVIKSTPVASDGKYIFVGLMPGDYTVLINNSPTASTATTLPTGWVNTGENIGTTAGSDVLVNGTSAKITLVATNQPNVNFGIELLPTPIDGAAPTTLNQQGTVQSLNVAGYFSGTDPAPGIVSSLTIVAFPTGATSIIVNGTTYLPSDPIWPANGGAGITLATNAMGVPLPSNVITVDPASDGDTEVKIPFVVTDNAGKVSTTTANVTVPFNTISISGKVFNDLNALIDLTVNGTPIHNPASTQLYANLLDATGTTVIATVPVNSAGVYEFTGVKPNTNYQVQISTVQGVATQPKPATSLPANWLATGENTGSGIGSDGNPNQLQSVTVTNFNVVDINFGIQEKQNPLSVNLLSFKANKGSESVQLIWKTANEQDFSHYSVERSVDGLEFTSIGKVAGIQQSEYQFIDNQPAIGQSYYRLLLVDQDGSRSKSKIVSVIFGDDSDYLFTENPAIGGTFTLRTNADINSLKLFNAIGQNMQYNLVYLTNGIYRVSIQNPVNGIYFVNILGSKSNQMIKKIMVR